MDKKTAYNYNKGSAKQRGIPFLLTFEEWWEIWRRSRKWSKRGRGAGKYCLSRYGDIGPYAVGNVYVNSYSANSSESAKRNIGKKHPPRSAEFCKKAAAHLKRMRKRKSAALRRALQERLAWQKSLLER